MNRNGGSCLKCDPAKPRGHFAGELELQLRRTYPKHKRTDAATRTMLVSLTVGKVDAGVAVLLTEDKRLVCSAFTPIAPQAAPGAASPQ